MRRLGWWLTWVKAICLKGGHWPKKKNNKKVVKEGVSEERPQQLKMNGFWGGGLSHLADWVTASQKPAHTIASNMDVIKKNPRQVQNPAGPCRTPGLTLWVSTMMAWAHPGLSDVSRCTQKSPFETITFVKGKGGVHRALADYAGRQIKVCSDTKPEVRHQNCVKRRVLFCNHPVLRHNCVICCRVKHGCDWKENAAMLWRGDATKMRQGIHLLAEERMIQVIKAASHWG